MKTYTLRLLPLLLLMALAACKTDYSTLPTYTPSKQLQAVIETPAGTNLKLKYNRETKEFVTDKEAGQNRVIGFLSYPGNFGFIPSTETNRAGKPLEILVLSESAAQGTVMEVIPIAVLQLETAGDLDHKIIAVPARPKDQTIAATDFYTLSTQYPAAKEILKQWFVHNTPTAHTKFVGWKDEKFAEKEIQRWMKL
ncbi:inorganic diphosphatase [Pontibacter vulgaris]|uniref:inorganic diphosphatase n=1 Tax=Pontibacter vulgaris TaxID=2905679 RepID=UPI001FA6DB13|nr:inorganic diphosphatase [Pontibacter vulgaris]